MYNFNFFNGWETWKVFAALWVSGFVWGYINIGLGIILAILVGLGAHQWYKTKEIHTGFDTFVWIVSILNAIGSLVLMVI